MELNDIYHAYTADPSFASMREKYNFVPGMGDEDSSIMFVGEAPGAKEDELREPFIGPAGGVLDRMLGSVGLDRDVDCFITNVVKYRPSDYNNDPTTYEIIQSLPYLVEEIKAVQPMLLVALGRVAARALKPGHEYATLRGNFYEYPLGMKLFVTYHPAYILHNKGAEKEYRSHFALIREYVDRNDGRSPDPTARGVE